MWCVDRRTMCTIDGNSIQFGSDILFGKWHRTFLLAETAIHVSSLKSHDYCCSSKNDDGAHHCYAVFYRCSYARIAKYSTHIFIFIRSGSKHFKAIIVIIAHLSIECRLSLGAHAIFGWIVNIIFFIIGRTIHVKQFFSFALSLRLAEHFIDGKCLKKAKWLPFNGHNSGYALHSMDQLKTILFYRFTKKKITIFIWKH